MFKPPATKPLTRFPRWLVWLAVVSTGLLIISGLAITLILVHFSHQSQAGLGSDILKQIDQYPALYQQAKLPQYPGADVTQISDSHATLQDHIVVYLSTPDDVIGVIGYWQSAMSKLDWQAEPIIHPDTNSAILTYKKDNQQYTATIIRDIAHKRTNILITWGQS